MDDDALKNYLPRYGDRVALKAFLQGNSSKQSKPSVIEKLMDRLRKRKNKEPESTKDCFLEKGGKESSSSNAKKGERTIHLGWLNYCRDDHKYKQVLTKNGGGTRKIKISKKSTKDEIRNIAVGLFFPNGRCKYGRVEHYELNVMDFKKSILSDDISVETMYEVTKLPVLRFYLATKAKVIYENDPNLQNFLQDDVEQVKVNEDQPSEIMVSSSILVGLTSDGDLQPSATNQPTDQAAVQVVLNNSEVTFGPFIASSEDLVLDDTLPYTSTPIQDKPYVMKIHRGNALSEMICYFKDASLLELKFVVVMILPNGTEEMGEGTGMLKDCLAEFWTDFYAQYCVGNQLKVPVTRHDLKDEEWNAIGRIIVKGWKEVQYFPVWLAPAIMEKAIFETNRTDLVTDLLLYLPNSDRNILQKAISNFESVDEDDLFDVLETLHLKRKVTARNIEVILYEVSYKIFIQDPRHIIVCLSEVMHNLFSSYEQLDSIYNELKPTCKKVLKLLQFPQTANETERETMHHLRKFVRELNDEELFKFLRFCTGANVMPMPQNYIQVAFVKMNPFERRPVAHTCGLVLELPAEYDNFVSFRNEFKSVLNSGIWVMDIA